jgi:hypothetical protein
MIERDNDDCTDTEDKKVFPSQSGAKIDLDELMGNDICDSYFPVHHPETRDFLQTAWVWPIQEVDGIDTLMYGDIMKGRQPLPKIRDYFGSHCSWYFAWMGYYTRSLLFAAIVGVVVEVFGFIDKDFPTLAAYSMFIAVWATTYLELWSVSPQQSSNRRLRFIGFFSQIAWDHSEKSH